MQVTVTFNSETEVVGFELFGLAKKFGYNPGTPSLISVEAEEGDDPEDNKAEEKAPRKRRTKVEMEAARAASKPAKKAKAAPVESDEEDSEDEDSEEDLGIEDGPKVYDLEKHVMPGFVKYKNKHGLTAAGDVLKKFIPKGKPINVRQIPAELYPEVMEALA